ncbi:MAG: M36 family metallopeptidase [Actinomycetota bacterium]|nr:M36 family metallopeptidase [Actinomycetota bacterium]
MSLGAATSGAGAIVDPAVGPGGGAAAGGDASGLHSIQGEGRPSGDQDNRQGRVAPTDRQRALAARTGAVVEFNELGTPAKITTTGTRFLDRGLPSDPARTARAYLSENRALFGLGEEQVAALEVIAERPLGDGAVVILRQQFGGLPAAHDGLVSVGVVDGAVVHVSSSLSRDAGAPAAATLTAAEALERAASNAGLSARELDTDRVRLVAVPTPNGVRAAYQVVLVANDAAHPEGYTSYVDARSGEVLIRESLVDHAEDNPEWEVFPANPPADYSSTDTRDRWCWVAIAGCDLAVSNDAAGAPWDVDQRTGTPTNTSIGNSAYTVEKWFSANSRDVGTRPATPSPTRTYAYPWTNQWYEEACSPTVFQSPQANDIDAAIANLFAMHNRMHDWSYELGFTEETWNLQQVNRGAAGRASDYEQGNAQAGGVVGGPPTFSARDNANQITPPDGVAPITNMYLWQPIAGGFYAPCVDGDYDMSVIGHEYTHAISNRMVAGPDAGLRGLQAGAMGESWSDLTAVEYMNEYDVVPPGQDPFAVGEYVTSDGDAGIRNYNMARSPLNYTDVGYDLTGPQVHADGEIWSATNFDIRSALIDRYGAGTAAQQQACADGETPVDQCPGNRRWMQLVFDAYLLMVRGDVSMVDARDAMLAADQIRFGGANQDAIWNTFAARGLGEGAASNTNADSDPVPSFSSPHAAETLVVFRPVDDRGPVPGAKLYVGDYEARAVPMADTDPSTARTDQVALVPGRYDLLVQAPGYGAKRLSLDVPAGARRDVTVVLERNLASASSGATATGDGVNLGKLIDDTEATNWAALDQPVRGRQVTVDLAGTRAQTVQRVQVSAMLRPADSRDQNDPGGQNRFTALRSFEVLACQAGGAVDCSRDADFTVVYTSPADAFPAIAPRPRAPELIIRSFDVPLTLATHLRLRVVDNQCTGAPDYAGEQDADPRANTDCSTASSAAEDVRAAEFQVFAR